MKAFLFERPFSEQVSTITNVIFPQRNTYRDRHIILPLELLRPTTIRILLSQEAAKEVDAEYVESEYTFSWDEGWDHFLDDARENKWPIFEYIENKPKDEEWESRFYEIPKYYLVVKNAEE